MAPEPYAIQSLMPSPLPLPLAIQGEANVLTLRWRRKPPPARETPHRQALALMAVVVVEVVVVVAVVVVEVVVAAVTASKLSKYVKVGSSKFYISPSRSPRMHMIALAILAAVLPPAVSPSQAARPLSLLSPRSPALLPSCSTSASVWRGRRPAPTSPTGAKRAPVVFFVGDPLPARGPPAGGHGRTGVLPRLCHGALAPPRRRRPLPRGVGGRPRGYIVGGGAVPGGRGGVVPARRHV